ncbi:peptidase S13 D-Ala-D-Ala carboxypeptidase C [Thecamonas trahens ATCC 50062]|uniref:Peptidase S13 D-Ala-D-Ala carboxypeptidase C n=1 Tax=Thecamonas trahens ATCC 50062 TaxID=461836 RepID=A0A0L0DAX4_THETB|nr:peptidase S13 D-Ala-D-Ala carboxypeptidase C [Thecamonas trahens ATCC 50062]KNC49487.1 peptidase S13 D-Ala-D-Ala carboxypeptidase C [Thecamonas trahens ATCC 50062]|eukprot:XP_013757906.1 peptidase S13 D-Ala-D-Ala carboxypeptidase C [Thecamonas trahens ATCC 50062]
MMMLIISTRLALPLPLPLPSPFKHGAGMSTRLATPDSFFSTATMGKAFSVVLALTALACCLAGAGQASLIPELAQQLEELAMSTPTSVAASWAYAVARADAASSDDILVSANAGRLYPPASNTKILTLATALLSATSPEKTALETQVWWSADSGRVCINGRGDPSMTADRLTGLASAAADKLGESSVTSTAVHVWSGYYPAVDVFPATWELDDFVFDYGSGINGAIVDENRVTFALAAGLAGSTNITVVYPPSAASAMPVDLSGLVIGPSSSSPSLSARYLPGRSGLVITGSVPAGKETPVSGYVTVRGDELFANTFAMGMNSAGVTVTDVTLVSRPCGLATDDTVVASTASDAVTSLAHHCLLVSDNTYAESFLRLVGNDGLAASRLDVPTLADLPRSAVAAGLARVHATLVGQLGVRADSFVQADGSGVSRRNLISADALVGTLIGMARHGPGYGNDSLAPLLPVAGESGTLASRFVGTPAQGRVSAKTGTLTGVSALSGYINRTGLGGDESRLVFSVIVTGYADHASSARAIIDNMVLAMLEVNTSGPAPSPAHKSKSHAATVALAVAAGVAGLMILIAGGAWWLRSHGAGRGPEGDVLLG